MDDMKPTYQADKSVVKNDLSPVGSKSDPCANTHNGKFVSFNGKKLVSTCSEGKIHTHRVAPNAIVRFDGTVCQSAEFKPGTKIRLTIGADKKQFVTEIEAFKRLFEFAQS